LLSDCKNYKIFIVNFLKSIAKGIYFEYNLGKAIENAFEVP
jgi:hypothetical protein